MEPTTQAVSEITSGSIFTQAGETMQGMLTMTGDFFSGLWSNPMGKIVITLGIVSGGIALCVKLFLKKKHV